MPWVVERYSSGCRARSSGAFVGGIVGFGPIDRCRSGRCSLKAVANDGGAAGGEFAVDRPWAMSSSRLPSPTMPPVASTLSGAPAGKNRAAAGS